MPEHIKTLKNGITVEFDNGSFDDWCVYVAGENIPRHAPTDVHYFNELSKLGHIYGHKKIYNDFLQFYEQTTADLNQKIIDGISGIASSYSENSLEIELWFTVIYAGMVAEENKKNAILKKRVKRLGMYQLLIEKQSAEYAANFSKGKKWKELDETMKTLGF